MTTDRVRSDAEPAADRDPDAEADPDAPTTRERVDPWLALEDGERVRWCGRPRIQTVYPRLAVATFGMAAVAAGIALEVIPLVALLSLPVFAALPLWRYVGIARTAYAITDRRVAVRRGVLGVSVRAVGLERVQNTTVTQGAIDRAIGAGTVAIETASGSTIAFRSIDDPLAVRTELERAAAGVASRKDPEPRARWAAIRDAVRGWRTALEETDERRQ
ncbi:PH domain-containing protein [Natronococcus sp. JC468]|uniref:PH domain-containing protein n=1 Tax=Natronococcus sp. JC468 TaxID=1961921 RepID=UPI00143B19E1|nr:PH domain-containing protein [Natronococcus sp. JC468]NKE35725.1 PH domain-containing protein [Natronococcus sp. JC468]